jgi:hypothetical protein
MRVNASEQVFEDANLLWLDVHGGLMFMIHAHGTWQGCPDKWTGEEYPPIQVEEGRPAVCRGFGYLMHLARDGRSAISLGQTGQPIKEEKGYAADVQEHEDGWTVTDSYGRVLELRVRWGAALWSVSHWP